MGSSGCWLTPNSAFLKGLVSPHKREGEDKRVLPSPVQMYCKGESLAQGGEGADMSGFTANTETASLPLEQSVCVIRFLSGYIANCLELSEVVTVF